jgi:monovalent cation:H+ antiporter, CPA1 family
MSLFETAAALISLAALFSYLNHRLLRLPTTIGLMILALLFSLGILGVGFFVPSVTSQATRLLAELDFSAALLHGMLGFLLFAGALHVDLGDLAEQKRAIALLATVGVVCSAILVAGMVWGLARLLGLALDPFHALLFGALISPTDPIAVLGLLTKLGAPRSLVAKITGESLFNDGVGVVLFLGLVGVAGLTPQSGHPGPWNVLELFAVEALGGIVFGFGVGVIIYFMLKSVDEYTVEVLLSLALVAGGYALAEALHVSAPIAMVVAGLLIGNHGRAFAMSATTREHLDAFWELVDETLNAVLFVLIGLEVLVLTFSGRQLMVGLLVIPAVLLARWVAVALPLTMLRPFQRFTPHAVKVLTWGGLRGGISVALALWLSRLMGPGHAATRDLLLVMTYCVVVFSIIVQGLTISPLLRHWGLTSLASVPSAR